MIRIPTTAFEQIIVADHTHGMTAPIVRFVIITLTGNPHILPIHITHEGTANHHSNDDGRALGNRNGLQAAIMTPRIATPGPNDARTRTRYASILSPEPPCSTT